MADTYLGPYPKAMSEGQCELVQYEDTMKFHTSTSYLKNQLNIQSHPTPTWWMRKILLSRKFQI